MKSTCCPRCVGEGYYIMYYGHSETDPRRIPCNCANQQIHTTAIVNVEVTRITTRSSHTKSFHKKYRHNATEQPIR